MRVDDRSLIIAEDDPLVSAMIAELARDLGWQVLGVASCQADAFQLLSVQRPRVAVLDIVLGMSTSLAIASTCKDLGIPVVFVTGYTARDIPRGCDNAPILAKPFTAQQLELTLARALGAKQQEEDLYSSGTRVQETPELKVHCPACGASNTLFADATVAHQKMNCSNCGTELGTPGDLHRLGADKNRSSTA